MRPWFWLEREDAVEFLRRLPTESIDLCVTDPAYESLEKHRAIGTTTRLTKTWFPIFPNSRFRDLFGELFRVMKVNTHLYVMCDQETMFEAVPTAELMGFTFWKPLIWDKVSIGMGYHYRARYEVVLFFEKGSRRIRDLGVADIITAKRVRGYPTEKPEGLSKVLVEQSSSPGDVVLDPFIGSGSIGAAAVKLDRNFIGCDVLAEATRGSFHRLNAYADARDSMPRPELTLT